MQVWVFLCNLQQVAWNIVFYAFSPVTAAETALRSSQPQLE